MCLLRARLAVDPKQPKQLVCMQAQRARMSEEMAQERERLEATHRSERQRIEDMYGMQARARSTKSAGCKIQCVRVSFCV